MVMVADEPSLFEGVTKLNPAVIVVDLSLVRGGHLNWLERLRTTCPDANLVVISTHDGPHIRERMRKIGVNAFVPKRSLATDLLPAIDRLMSESSQQTGDA